MATATLNPLRYRVLLAAAFLAGFLLVPMEAESLGRNAQLAMGATVIVLIFVCIHLLSTLNSRNEISRLSLYVGLNVLAGCGLATAASYLIAAL